MNEHPLKVCLCHSPTRSCLSDRMIRLVVSKLKATHLDVGNLGVIFCQGMSHSDVEQIISGAKGHGIPLLFVAPEDDVSNRGPESAVSTYGGSIEKYLFLDEVIIMIRRRLESAQVAQSLDSVDVSEAVDPRECGVSLQMQEMTTIPPHVFS